MGKGELFLKDMEMTQKVTFLDYIFGGCEIGVHIAIDYTLSNGHALDPISLHYLDKQTNRNQYTEAIHAVCSILQDYDADQMFPVYGFGGKLPNSPDLNSASHNFALNGDFFSPEVNGTQGVLKAYYDSLNKITLHGPTNFAPTLELVNGFAEYQQME